MTNYYYMFIFTFKFCIFSLCGNVLAFNNEYLVGGYTAEEHTFTYQVAVIGKQNYSNDKFLLCSGGIISEDLILSSAQCFFDTEGHFHKMSLSVKADTIDLKTSKGIEIDVDSVLLPDYDLVLSLNDIAVLKLQGQFNLGLNSNLSKLDIPLPGQLFVGKLGIVASYGYNWIETAVDSFSGEEIRVQGRTDYILKYAFVRIAEGLDCNNSRLYLTQTRHMCGVMMTDVSGEKWGICAKDVGSPLVIHNVVAGIASSNRADCDDTIDGCLYINVSAYTFFLEMILSEQTNIDGVPVNTAIRFPNRPHISPFLSLV